MKTEVKALVVGGGAVGTSIAYHLARAGWDDVMLLERDELTSGSTWHAAGLLPYFNMSYATTHIHDYSIKFYKTLEEETGLNAGFFVAGEVGSRLVNNIIARKGPASGSAVYWVGAGVMPLEILANDLDGWDSMLTTDRFRPGTDRYAASAATTTSLRNVDALNGCDGDWVGGPVHGNVSEAYLRTFRVVKTEDYHLSPSSICVNAGVDVSGPDYAGPIVDMDGETRPAPSTGIRPVYDIGADELH